MSTTYSGKATAILSSTNATPIVVTANAHGYLTGDVVSVSGHGTNTNANGEWTITKVDANSFSLNSSVGNGVGGVTGTVTSFVSAATIPSDGDGPIQASDVNPAFEASMDREQLLYYDFKQRMQGLFPIVPAKVTVRVMGGTPTYDPLFDSSIVSASFQTTANTVGRMNFPVDIPHGATWTAYGVLIDPSSTGHSALPVSPYSFAAIKMNIATGVISDCAGFTNPSVDPAASVLAYDTPHTVTSSGGTEVVDRTAYCYFIRVTSESGTHALGSTVVYSGPTVTFTARRLDIGAA